MRRSLPLFLMLISCLFSGLSGQRVRDVEMTQSGKNVIIEYTLEASSPQEIKLYVSKDGGRSYSAPLRKVSGDVGKGIKAGRKRIEWRVLEEVDELVGDRIVFMVEIVEEAPVVKYTKPKPYIDYDDLEPEGGNVRIGALFEVMESSNAQSIGYGFRFEWFVSPGFSMDWQFLFGNNYQGDFYTQVPGAAVAFSEQTGNPWLAAEVDEGTLSLFLLGLMLPEGFTIHMFPHPRIELAPSLTLLRADYNNRNNQKTTLGGAITLRMNYQPFRRFTLSPALGVRLDYETGDPSLLYGLGLGLRL